MTSLEQYIKTREERIYTTLWRMKYPTTAPVLTIARSFYSPLHTLEQLQAIFKTYIPIEPEGGNRVKSRVASNEY